MVCPDPAIERKVIGLVRRLRGLDPGHFQRVIWFGSSAAGSNTVESDLDVMIVVDPAGPWTPKHNVAERQRLERAMGTKGGRLDLWVRTIDQFEEARDVVGGLEYAAATRGRVLYERRPVRPPVVRLTKEQIRRRNVFDWLELGRRLLGRSVEIAYRSRVSEHPSGHYAARSARAAIGALFVARGIDPPNKSVSITDSVNELDRFDSRSAQRLRGVIGDPIVPACAHEIMRFVVTQLISDKSLVEPVLVIARYLGGRVEELGPTPPLKTLGG